jgi:hypothetical protein
MSPEGCGPSTAIASVGLRRCHANGSGLLLPQEAAIKRCRPPASEATRMTIRGRPPDRNPDGPSGRVVQPAAMTSQPSRTPPRTCAARPPCPGPPCFLIEFHAPPGSQCDGRGAAACPGHLGEVVCDVATWAHEHGLDDGEVTVLAIDRSPVSRSPAGSREAGQGFVFGSIRLGPADS